MATAPPGRPDAPLNGRPPTSPEPRRASSQPLPWLLRLVIAALVLGGVAAGCLAVLSRWSSVEVAAPAPSPVPATPIGAPHVPTSAAATSAPAEPSPTASTATARSTTSTSARPRPTGTQTLQASGAPTRPRRSGLTDNALYDVALEPGAGRCTAKIRRPALPDDQLADYLDTLTACLTKALKPPLAAAGITATNPGVHTYRGRIDTPCGHLQPATAPAYYCSGDGVIYVPYAGDETEAYASARLGYLALIAHEYGHHLQYLSGIFDGYTTRYTKADAADRDQLSRRLELQADCFAGVFLDYVSTSVDFGPNDRAQLRNWHRRTGDAPGGPADHGSSAAQIRWLERGLDSADYGRCDTWSAAADRVS